MTVELGDVEAERIAVILEEHVLEAPNGTLPKGVRPGASMFVDELRERVELDAENHRPCCPACGSVIGATWKDGALSFAVDRPVTVTGYCPECANEFVNEPLEVEDWKP